LNPTNFLSKANSKKDIPDAEWINNIKIISGMQMSWNAGIYLMNC
jgi:hypothetical protein